MNVLLRHFFQDSERTRRLTKLLPEAFAVAANEVLPGSPAIGTLREFVISGFFVQEFGPDIVSFPELGSEKSYNLKIEEMPLSICTVSGYSSIKVKWTVDPSKVEDEIKNYSPQVDIFLVNIQWGKNSDSLFYFPVSTQLDVIGAIGRENYLHAPIGTNHRGISISSGAMRELKSHTESLKAPVEWGPKPRPAEPQERWVEWWKARLQL